MSEGSPRPADRRLIGEFAFGFLCVFLGLAVPSPGLGPLYSSAHTAIANGLVSHEVAGAHLYFEATADELQQKPFQTTLHIDPPGHAQRVAVPIDLRTLGYLPTAAFIALAVAAPLGNRRKNLKLLGGGLLILEPLILLLISLPLVSFLAGGGPLRLIHLGPVVHTSIEVLYRALVVPPGMAYAVPLLLFVALWAVQRRNREGERRLHESSVI